MKKFNLANVTSFQDYKSVRFQKGMPKLTTCKIKLGEIMIHPLYSIEMSIAL